MGLSRSGMLGGLIGRFAGRLRFPQLFLLTGLLFVVDLIVPDLLPMADELLLGLATVLLGSWKERGEGSAQLDEKPPEKDITPSASHD